MAMVLMLLLVLLLLLLVFSAVGCRLQSREDVLQLAPRAPGKSRGIGRGVGAGLLLLLHFEWSLGHRRVC
jgi:hypothetical protein